MLRIIIWIQIFKNSQSGYRGQKITIRNQQLTIQIRVQSLKDQDILIPDLKDPICHLGSALLKVFYAFNSSRKLRIEHIKKSQLYVSFSIHTNTIDKIHNN